MLQAVLNIISNPVNSTVPIAAETLKRMGVYDKRKVLGVTTLDVVSVDMCDKGGDVNLMGVMFDTGQYSNGYGTHSGTCQAYLDTSFLVQL